MTAADPGGLEFISSGLAARSHATNRRRRSALGVLVAVTVVWVLYVSSTGKWGRVTDNWVASLTMVFGSFVTGLTPHGAEAVAFPVFTKGSGIPSEVARTFSLSIQAVGLGCAALAILITRRRVAWASILRALPPTLIGLAVALVVLTDHTRPFLPSTLPPAYVKVTFTLLILAMALITFLGARVPVRLVRREAPPMNARIWVLLTVACLVGGVAAGLTGSGADLLFYLVMVVMLTVDPGVGGPTAVMLMAIVSIVGLVALGALYGQLDVNLSQDGSHVVSVGDRAVTNEASSATAPVFGAGGSPLPARQTDVFGMWLAGVPVVAWGVPLGSAVAARVSTRKMLTVVWVLAGIETLSTVIFLDALWSDPLLVAYATGTAVVVAGGMWWMAKNRRSLFRLPPLEHSVALSRSELETRPDYRAWLLPVAAQPSRRPGPEPDKPHEEKQG